MGKYYLIVHISFSSSVCSFIFTGYSFPNSSRCIGIYSLKIEFVEGSESSLTTLNLSGFSPYAVSLLNLLDIAEMK